jgi:hypothetical protein
VVVALSVSLCSLTAALLFYTGIWHDLSVSLDMTPWREKQDALLAEAVASGTALEEVPLRCPFYKVENPETQCRACGTVVSRSGVHEVCACWGGGGQSGLALPSVNGLHLGLTRALRARKQENVNSLGNLVLDWSRAMHVRTACSVQHGALALTTTDVVAARITQAVKRTDDIALARIDLSNALGFVGNPGLCQVSRCCLGASAAVRAICSQARIDLPPRSSVSRVLHLPQVPQPPATPGPDLHVHQPDSGHGAVDVLEAVHLTPSRLQRLRRRMQRPLRLRFHPAGAGQHCHAHGLHAEVRLRCENAPPAAETDTQLLAGALFVYAHRYSWIEFLYPNGVFDDRWRDVLCGLFASPIP